MSLKLSKVNTAPYDYFSELTDLNPMSSSVTLDNTGGVKFTDTITTYLVATTFNYTNIRIEPVQEETGINYRVSLNGINWAEFVNPNAMDATSGDVITPIYFGVAVNNDNTVPTGNHTGCKLRIIATENP